MRAAVASSCAISPCLTIAQPPYLYRMASMPGERATGSQACYRPDVKSLTAARESDSMRINRCVVIVLDSVGIGALPDADAFGDVGSDTLGNLARTIGGLDLPQLAALGLGNIAALKGVAPAAQPAAAYGKLAEQSAGKDTSTGHWELMGVRIARPFPVYQEGFPHDVI